MCVIYRNLKRKDVTNIFNLCIDSVLFLNLCLLLEIMSAAGPEVIDASAAAMTSTSGLSASTVFFFLLIPALVLYYIYFKISRRHMIELAESIPGPDGLPLIGNALLFLGTSDSKI